MSKFTFSQIEQNVAEIANRSSYTPDFLYELLAAYGRPLSSITMLKNGALNKAIEKDEVLQKDVVYFKVVPKGTMLEAEVLISNDLVKKYKPRYVIVTDLTDMAAKDLKKGDTLSIHIRDIDRNFTFFYGWSGNEKIEEKEESELDRRAADCMKDLYDAIEHDNEKKILDKDLNFRHNLNLFFSRLLFCFFAEDTGLFQKNLFSDSVKNFTETDGSDTKAFLERVFDALDTADKSAMGQPFSDFPYVDGSIFDSKYNKIEVPVFGPESRYMLLRCSNFNWSDINPDIFGTIFQGIVDPNLRGQNGMDYTSVSNINKVIEPLFMDELEAEFEKGFESDSRVKDKVSRRLKHLDELWERISKIKIFDPACGSGNFLIISYKRLRELELRILQEKMMLQGSSVIVGRFKSRIELKNFYGIELEDFPRELAVLSMFIAEHQMNMMFNEEFGKRIEMLPIEDNPHIVCGNAARLDWQEICPNREHRSVLRTGQVTLDGVESGAEDGMVESSYDEIYVIGNPPYKGSALQSPAQKSDFKYYFDSEPYSAKLDYISLWFIKGARYISETRARLAFVTTNSVCQGEQVSLLFPKIYECDVEIGFAYTSFKWSNNAKNQAGVTVAIVGLRSFSNDNKYIFTDGFKNKVSCINAYLVDSNQKIVSPVNVSISGFPYIGRANALMDDNIFNLDIKELAELKSLNENLIKYYYGAEEFINGKKRPILWIEDEPMYYRYKENAVISAKIEAVRKFREGLKSGDGKKMALTPWAIKNARDISSSAVIIPRVSSERREYIPMGFLGSDSIIGDSAIGAYDAELWLFAILESKMHMAWIRTVCGKLKTDYRYSSTLGYNAFPCPPLTSVQKDALSKSAENILMMRENHSEMTLAQMYDPDKMPADLKRAHEDNDVLVDLLYRNHAFGSDEERLAILFDLYEKMTNK